MDATIIIILGAMALSMWKPVHSRFVKKFGEME